MIVYELESETPVTLEAYDLYGRKVASLMQGVQSSGTRTFTWNLTSALGQRLNSGIYTITLKAGTESLTKKVVIN
jgi:flagellar hook assembly protein FlgD